MIFWVSVVILVLGDLTFAAGSLLDYRSSVRFDGFGHHVHETAKLFMAKDGRFLGARYAWLAAAVAAVFTLGGLFAVPPISGFAFGGGLVYFGVRRIQASVKNNELDRKAGL